MKRSKLEPILLPTDALSIPKGREKHSGRTLICIRYRTVPDNILYEFFDEGDIFWLPDHVCLHYLDTGAMIIKADL